MSFVGHTFIMEDLDQKVSMWVVYSQPKRIKFQNARPFLVTKTYNFPNGLDTFIFSGH